MKQIHNGMSRNIQDYIFKIDDFLDQETCKHIVKKIKKLPWEKHSYYDSINNTYESYDNELSVIHGSQIPEANIINEKLSYALKIYLNKLNFDWYNSFTGYQPIRFNRYDKNTVMKLHCDHIHSLFDGTIKGVPVLTMLGCLNNNYKGGELIMFDQEVIELKAGNLLLFPSNFLFPHEVKPVLLGTRFSYVSWCW